MQCNPNSNPVFLSNPSVPFTKRSAVHFGRLFTIKGSALPDARAYALNFYIGGKEQENALHLNVRFNEGSIVRNSCEAGSWCREERNGGFPLRRGEKFELMVLVEEARFMIAFDGAHFTEFVHRRPVSTIDTISIIGDIKITTYQESMGFAGSEPGRPLALQQGSLPHYDLGPCLVPGGKIHIGGRPTRGTFVIDLRPDVESEDIGLHMSCRVEYGLVVLNSRIGKAWQEEVRPQNIVFLREHYFHLRISCENETEIIVTLNGYATTTFPIRHIPAVHLKRLVIHGDVKIGYVTL